jgi:hypothetical protein
MAVPDRDAYLKSLAPEASKKGPPAWLVAGGLVLAVMAVVAVVGILAASKASGSSATKITAAEFAAISEGMSYADVVRIVGDPGVEEVSSTMPGVPGVMPDVSTKQYRWINWNGGNASAMFQNDRMIMKAQFGLR